MTTIDLTRIPYPHRFNASSLLIAKANRLAGATSGSGGASPKQLHAAVAYFDMALLLMKPYDPNYATVANWKCNVLLKLGQYEEAVAWYREIVRISDETDGKAARNPTAAYAEKAIAKHAGRENEPLPDGGGIGDSFDDPPYCTYAEEFLALLVDGKFKQAHACLARPLQEKWPVKELKETWGALVGGAKTASLAVSLEQHLLDWPARTGEQIGWCNFSIAAEKVSEGMRVLVARTPLNTYEVADIEWGRP